MMGFPDDVFHPDSRPAMTQPNHARPDRARQPFRLGTALALLLTAGAPLGLLLFGAGCNGKKADFTKEVTEDSGDGSDATGKGEKEPKKAGFERPSYTPPADPEMHRIDMLEFEREAYTVLRKFSVGQRAFVTDIKPGPPVDLDGDGVGEYAFLWELMGVSYCRTPGGLGRAPVTASWPLFKASDVKGNPFMDTKAEVEVGIVRRGDNEYLVDRGGVVFWVDSGGVAERTHYYFLFFLPGKKRVINAGGAVPKGDPALADLHERRFAGIAWPKKNGVTGRRLFFVCKPEEVWARWNIGDVYDGKKRIPKIWSALDRNGANPYNLDADVAHVESKLEPFDGGKWKVFGERKGIRRDKFEWQWSKDQEIEDYRADGGPDAPWMKGEEKKGKSGKK
jgi:hypothetical protein